MDLQTNHWPKGLIFTILYPAQKVRKLGFDRLYIFFNEHNIGRIGYHFKAWIIPYQTVAYFIWFVEWGGCRRRKCEEGSRRKCCNMNNILALGILDDVRTNCLRIWLNNQSPRKPQLSKDIWTLQTQKGVVFILLLLTGWRGKYSTFKVIWTQ